MNVEDKRFVIRQLLWIGISFAISATLSLLLPPYISLPLTIGIFLFMAFYVRRRAIKKMTGGTSSPFASMFRADDSKVKFYCMTCGTKHNNTSCPLCGSRLKKAGF